MTTEELKREMFYAIAGMKGRIEINHSVKDMLGGVDHFEHALEAYLEELRQEAQSNAAQLSEAQKYSGILSDAYTHQQQLTHAACVSERETWADNHDLRSRVRELENGNACGFDAMMKIRGERDELRNKLQAFEFANKSAGELLIRAQETIKRQRKFIRTLYTSRKARKVVGATRIQSSAETGPCVKCGGLGRILLGFGGFPVVPLTEKCPCGGRK